MKLTDQFTILVQESVKKEEMIVDKLCIPLNAEESQVHEKFSDRDWSLLCKCVEDCWEGNVVLEAKVQVKVNAFKGVEPSDGEHLVQQGLVVLVDACPDEEGKLLPQFRGFPN